MYITGEIREQSSILEDSGVQRVMLQWLDMDDTEGLKALAEGILSELQLIPIFKRFRYLVSNRRKICAARYSIGGCCSSVCWSLSAWDAA
jgi:hypothetical protein